MFSKDDYDADVDDIMAIIATAKLAQKNGICFEDQEALEVQQEQTICETQLSAVASVEPVHRTGSYGSFDLTHSVQSQMDVFRPNIAITNFEDVFLSNEEIKSLKPVLDRTIQSLLILLVKQPCESVMLNGDLLAQTRDGRYIKVMPWKDKKGYSAYRFTAINWSILSKNINDLEQLLCGTAAFETWMSETCDEVQREWKPLTLEEELRQFKDDYCKSVDLRSLLLLIANKTFEGTNKTAYVARLASAHFYKTSYISQHRLSAWVYQPEQYRKISEVQFDANGAVVDYEVHHVDGDRSNNRPENLAIISKAENAALTRNSKPVTYKDKQYLSLSAYCEATSAGSLRKLQHATKDLKLGDTKDYNGRCYTMDAEGKLTASELEAPQQGTQVDFNGTVYQSLADFAKATKLSAGGLRKKLYDMRTAETTGFKWKGFEFNVLENTVKAIKL